MTSGSYSASVSIPKQLLDMGLRLSPQSIAVVIEDYPKLDLKFYQVEQVIQVLNISGYLCCKRKGKSFRHRVCCSRRYPCLFVRRKNLVTNRHREGSSSLNKVVDSDWSFTFTGLLPGSYKAFVRHMQNCYCWEQQEATVKVELVL